MKWTTVLFVRVLIGLALATCVFACGSSTTASDADDASASDLSGDVSWEEGDSFEIIDETPPEDGTTDDGAVPDVPDEVSADIGDDGDTALGDVVGLLPEEVEHYISPAGGETIRPHRHALPIALGSGVYAIIVDVQTGSLGEPERIGFYRFDPASLELRQAWLDEAGVTTDYNSVGWTGTAFVAALPTPLVGLRVLSMSPDGTLLRPPVVLEPDAAYSPAGAGQPPVVLCTTDGPFVVDHGRGAGGTDRVYLLAPDGAYLGSFVDADLPAFSTTPYYASTPCAAAGAEAACATNQGLVFVRRDGTYRASEVVPAPGICPSGMGCDAAWTVDGVASVWMEGASAVSSLFFAGFGADGALRVPPSAGADVQTMVEVGIRAASSGATVLVSGPGPTSDPVVPIHLYLLELSGALIGVPVRAAACRPGGLPGGDCPMRVGGGATTPVVWEGDAYAALWVQDDPGADGVLVYRRFALDIR